MLLLKVVLCGGTSKIPKLQSSLQAAFPNAELLNSINPDEVIAVGAAKQASLLTFDDEKVELNASVGFQGLNYDLVYFSSIEDHASQEPKLLISRLCPIPVRRSHHFAHGHDTISVKVYLRSATQHLTALAEVSGTLSFEVL